jgi:hypothetical protein
VVVLIGRVLETSAVYCEMMQGGQAADAVTAQAPASKVA